MTKEIQDKINEQYPNPEGLSDILFDTRKINAAKRTGAAFGYQLASEQLLEKDKTIEVLKKEVDVLISQRTIRDARINDLEAALRELVAQADPIDDRWNYMAAIEKAKSLLTK